MQLIFADFSKIFFFKNKVKYATMPTKSTGLAHSNPGLQVDG
jgi:hypothetical protein